MYECIARSAFYQTGLVCAVRVAHDDQCSVRSLATGEHIAFGAILLDEAHPVIAISEKQAAAMATNLIAGLLLSDGAAGELPRFNSDS